MSSAWMNNPNFVFLIKLLLFGFPPNMSSLIKQKYWFKKLLRNKRVTQNPTRQQPPWCAAALENVPLTTWKLNDALLSHSGRKKQLLFEVRNLHRTSLRIIKRGQKNFVYRAWLCSDVRAAWFHLQWRLPCTPSGSGQSEPPGSAVRT